ncbi:MAG: beta-mannosidase [Lachnospiraceae bacterium]|nr:beta-mannosidase [Lachnospiraceae bacterium]MEE0919475.1 glycosyl hydrolase [Lachnospiraceae bacterium]
MQKTSNPNACASAKRLLNYLSETAGKAIITGQHTQTKPMEEIDYIRDNTGKEPLLRGFELLAYSPNINYDDASQECLTEVYENRETIETALDWARKTNGIVTLTFHWFSPLGGYDKSFYSKNTDFDAEKVLIENTHERAAFYHDMDVIAHELRKFQKEDIPVLWRPFHEAEGDWFWWGAKGPVIASKLYCMMYEYYTNILHLDNLIWVWNCPVKEAYPGDEYVDIVSVDIYLTGYEKTDYHIQYEQLIKETSPNKTAALAEVGYIPDINILEQSHIPWAYYMTWSKEFCIGEQYNSLDNLKSMYDSGYSLCMG